MKIMKKIVSVLIGGVMLFVLGCTKLKVPIQSQYTPANFPTTSSDYTAAIGPIYTQLANSSAAGTRYAVEYWRMQELSTDEAIIPARDGNYDDGGQYRFLHLHTWSPDHPNVTGCWEWGFGAIDQCNSLLNLFNAAPNSATKSTALAEVRAMRDLFYFFMLDLYGNIPIIDTFPVIGSPATMPRAQVFTFIENDLKSILPTLTMTVDATTYGRATKFMAFALLEKMYLNAAYYTGTPRYTDAVAMADSIQLQGTYALDANYGSVFAPTNGPGVKETIFAVPYDANLIPGDQMSRYGFASYVYPLYNLPGPSSVAMSTDSGFYHQNFVLPGDTRDTFWLRGPQHYFPNQAIETSLYPSSILPVLENLYPLAIYPASNIALYADYTSGTLPGVAYYLGAPYNIAFWNINYTDSLVLRGDPSKMDIGDDVFAQCEGIRSKKFYPDPNENPQTEDQNNDIPVFRLADVLMMKAEAILRGASATTVKGVLQTPVVLTNMIRARVGAQLATSSYNLDSVLPERAREFAWEGWRRNDLIRFGAFEGAWGFNPGNPGNTNLRIYPVPSTELSLNPNLVQNPGY
jgi:starch-binding outer membrane protein, SusD/RagB family